MTGQQAIKKLLYDKNVSQSKLCAIIYGEDANVSKIHRPLNSKDFRLSLFVRMAEELGYEVVLRPHTGKEKKDEIRISSESETESEYDKWKKITVNGVTHSPAEWGKINGISKQAIYFRLKHGMSPEDAVTLPAKTADLKGANNEHK